jgi:hypothetical protein
MKLWEVVDNGSVYKREKFLDQVIPHCGKYLRAVQASQSWFLRGILTQQAWFGPQESQLREPRDSDTQSSRAFDEILKDMGCVALRQNSIFVTSNWSKADFYTQSGPKTGAVYVILCDDNCHYTWTDYEDIILGPRRLPFDEIKAVKWWNEYISWLQSRSDLTPRERWFMSQAGVISGIAAYREALRYPEMRDDMPSLASMIDREKFQQQFKPQCDNFPGLVKAMTEQKEIYVQGRYWAIQLTTDLDQELEKRGLPPAMNRKNS